MFLVIVLFVITAVVVLLVLREQADARRAGMSDATPVCARCHYHLGGWTSPICPECGTDIRAVGVRIGPQSTQIVLGILVILFCLIVVGPLVSSGMAWIFARKSFSVHARYQSASLPSFSVTFDCDYEWARFPPDRGYRTNVYVIRAPAQGGSWVNGRYVGPAPAQEQALTFTSDAPRSRAPSVDTAVREVLGPEVDEAVIVSHVEAVESLVETMLHAQSRGRLDAGFVRSWRGGPFSRPPRSWGGGGGTHMAWPGIIITVAVVIFCSWFGVRQVNRRCRAGWRLPRKREWEHAAATSA